MRFLLICWVLWAAQAPGQIIVHINDAKPIEISAVDLAQLPRQSAVLDDHGRHITYEGVLMKDVLARGGVDFGKGLRGKQLTTYVKAVANDGYQVVYALAEFDPTIVDSGILVADKRDGQSLGANEGPLRIVVPHDKRPTRSLRMLKEIDVVQLSQ